MDVVFLRSNELNWEENFERCRAVLGNKVKLVDGSKATSIKNAYEFVLEAATTTNFMMVEADNYLYDRCADFLDCDKAVKFWTTNKYGIQYEHGGVKILNADLARRQMKTNANIVDNFEISANLFLESSNEVLSEHRFDWSEKNEWTTIAKELIKLHYWSCQDYMDRWLAHEKPRGIYEDLQQVIDTVSFSDLFETLLPSLGKIYESKFKK